MKNNSSLIKYDYLRRLNVTCDLLRVALSSGAQTLPELVANWPQIKAELIKEHDEEYVQHLFELVFPEVAEALLNPKHLQPTIKFAIALKKYVLDLGKYLDEGKPVVYNWPTFTPEVWYAMGVVPVFPFEAFAGLLSGLYTDGLEAENDEAEKQGFAFHICSFTKGPIKAIEVGKLPKPDLIIKNSSPCDSSNLNYQYAAYVNKCPLLILDSPYYTNQRALKYYVQNVREMLEEGQKITGMKLDVDKLRYHCEISNRQMKYMYGLQRLRKEVPCPDPGMMRFLDFGTLVLCGHSDLVPAYLEQRYKEVKERHERGETFLPPGKKEIRTLWSWGWVANMFYLPHWLEETFGSTYMECQLSYLPEDITGFVDTTNLDTMLEGLARRSMNFVMHRTAMSYSDIWVNDFVTIARSHKVDVAIFGGNRACKHAWTLCKILSDALQEQLGIPTLVWEHDVCDKRFMPHSKIKELLTEFFTTVAQ